MDQPAAKPIPAKLEPYEAKLDAGKTYAWCACGRSKTQPFCDGAHTGTGLMPHVFKAEKSGTVYFCGCKATKKVPFCDGSHTALATKPR
jgi:CDGSH-type Zn-finger protein